MEKIKISKSYLLSPNIKILALPILIVVVVGLLSVLIIKTGYPRIIKQIKDLKSEKTSETSLNDKLSILKEVSKQSLLNSDVTVIALPEKNSAMLIISQFRNSAMQNMVAIDKILVERPQKIDEEINKANVTIELMSQDLVSLLSLLKDMTKIAPIIKFQKVSIEKSRRLLSGYEASITITLYWSQLPTSLPAITDVSENLTTKENDTMKLISGLKKPVFTELEPNGPEVRRVPFN